MCPADAALSAAAARAAARPGGAKSDEFRAGVVDFAVGKSLGEAALRSGDRSAAAEKYGETLDLMEKMAAMVPPDKAGAIRAQIASTRAKMEAELAGK